MSRILIAPFFCELFCVRNERNGIETEGIELHEERNRVSSAEWDTARLQNTFVTFGLFCELFCIRNQPMELKQEVTKFTEAGA
jgi:hypothetical protein